MRKILSLAGAALLLAACGQHPDGTPMGTDPTKTEAGRAAAAADTARPASRQNAVPKGPEVNATTNNGTIGTPGDHGLHGN